MLDCDHAISEMPSSISAPNISLKLENLNQDAFSQFGTVVQNPAHFSGRRISPTPKVIEANQGSASKYINVSHLTNHYGSASSGQPARLVVNMFVCKPRKLRSRKADDAVITDQVVGNEVEQVFDVGILERHPFTPQMFVPMGVSKGDVKTKYLVVVAPTLPDSRPSSNRTLRRMRSIFFPWRSISSIASGDLDSAAPIPKGSGLPDLTRARAFLADGSQAVTYGPGTWHAPMVVLGDKPIDFVVVQYANGVADEDCQEVLLESRDGEGLKVVVEIMPQSLRNLKAKL